MSKIGRWKTSAGLTFWGSIIQSTFSLIGLIICLYLIFNLIDILLSGILPSVASMSLDYYEQKFASFLGGTVICFVIAFLGYLLYLIGICLFKTAQRSYASSWNIGYLIVAELIMPGLFILYKILYSTSSDFMASAPIPILVTVCVLYLVAVIIPVVEFNHLSKEDTWSEHARKGADDLKFSYSCILWILGVLILGLGLIAITIYSYYTKFQSMQFESYGMNSALQGINSISQDLQSLSLIVKLIMVCMCIVVFIFAVLQTIYRIMGWNKIRIGGNEEVYQYSNNEITPVQSSHFCHKCGQELPEGSAFCPGCGTSVLVAKSLDDVEKVNECSADTESKELALDILEDSSLSSDVPIEYENEESDDKKKWMLWGGIAAGVLVVAVGLWAILGRSDKFEPNANVFVIDSVVYQTIVDGNGENPLATLVYGTQVQDIEDEKEDDIWTEVRFEENGKARKGFINKHNIMSLQDFEILEVAGFDDENLRNQLPERLQRLAIVDAAKTLEKEWRIEIMDDADTYANAKNVYIRNVSPTENCFAFALEKKDGENERKAYVYSLPLDYEEGNIGQPVYLYDENIPIDQGTIHDVIYNKRNKRYTVSYLMRYGYCGEEEDGYVTVEEVSPAFYSMVDLHGQIDGKYNISMTFYENEDYAITGWYKYLNTNVPIDLSGKFSNIDDATYRLEQNLVIDEYVDGKNTGSFIGRYDGDTFSGKWVNADGSKELPFHLER